MLSLNEKKEKSPYEQSTPLWITTVLLAGFLLITVLKAGAVGKFLYNLLRYLFGQYYPEIVILFIIWRLANNWFKKNGLPRISTAALLLFICDLQLIFTLVMAGFLEAMPDTLMAYLRSLPQYLNSVTEEEVTAGGGIIGIFLYSLFSFMFERVGVIIFVIIILVIIIVLIKPQEYAQLGRALTETRERQIDSRRKRKQRHRRAASMEVAEKKKKAPEDETFFRRLIRKAGDILFLPQEEEEPIQQIPYKANDRKQEEALPILQENGLRRIDVTGRYKTVEETPRSFSLTADEEPAKEPEEPANAFKPKSTSPKTIRRSRSGRYELPKPTLLEPSSVKNLNADNERAAQEKGRILIRILANFDINADMLDIHIGPSVTQFEIRPDANIKVSRISSLTDNIKMQLAAKDIRIEAPIPGRNAVGIEIPNEHKTIVRLRDLITKNDDANPLMIYLGKDLYGRTVTCPINRMPHLLIAGATGSGKSVCMNAIILSLLLRTNPDDVKMLLVDPKKVEFTPYANIPHLIGPIINDAGKASNALKVICRIMDERYDMFAKARVRKIDEYNKLVDSQTSDTNEDGSPALKKMPYIVVIIDELADLMMVAGKDVENSIVRITQLARAAGIHMIIATQRPSVDVITGLIKSNVPARIAFAVSSGVDSRTILDRYGAERLLGDGDMLYLPMGSNAPIRVQGAFVSDSEVKTITDYVSSQAIPVYDDAFVLLDGIEGGEDFELVSGTEDTLYDQAKLFVIEKQKASTSLLQRNFGIGYNRAAKIIDQLERNGVIGPANGSKPREVFMKGSAEEDE